METFKEMLSKMTLVSDNHGNPTGHMVSKQSHEGLSLCSGVCYPQGSISESQTPGRSQSNARQARLWDYFLEVTRELRHSHSHSHWFLMLDNCPTKFSQSNGKSEGHFVDSCLLITLRIDSGIFKCQSTLHVYAEPIIRELHLNLRSLLPFGLLLASISCPSSMSAWTRLS